MSKHMDIKCNCEFCEFQTSHQANLKKHTTAMHGDNDEKQENLKRCSLCDFTTLWSLKRHMKRVHKESNKGTNTSPEETSFILPHTIFDQATSSSSPPDSGSTPLHDNVPATLS